MRIPTFVLAVLIGTSAIAQDNPCSTDRIYQKHIQDNPEIEQHVDRMDRVLRYPQVDQRGGTYYIPIVFHVVHKGGSENISKEQIENAVWHLNQDFRGINVEMPNVNPVFVPLATDANIEFRLAQVDPQGNCTDGITRHYSSRTFHGDEEMKVDFPGWDNERYMNVWVCSQIASGANGYAYLPDVVEWGPWHDGIVIKADKVGTIGLGVPNSRRTLTHEAGHYLGLRHTFQGGCDEQNDGVDDTPPTAEENFGCADGQNTCSLDVPDLIDHLQNHMEYTNCRYMFTHGQRDRMHGAIEEYRTLLVSPGNHSFTGIFQDPPNECQPTAEFQSDLIMLCEGEEAQFFDDTYNGDPTAWSWSFDGGTPSTSDEENPTTTYTSSGVYDVTLTASNDNGSSSFTRNDIVIVSSGQGETTLPFSESFEFNSEFTRFIVEDPELPDVHWQVTSAGGSTGARSVMLNNFDNDLPDVTDALITPAYDLSLLSDPQVTFKIAFAETDEDENNDRLRAYVSGDCGETWSLRFNRSGAQLATAPATEVGFAPSPSQWEEHEINLSSVQSEFTNARIKFEFTAGGGNNIYIDDINISGEVGVYDLRSEFGAVLYPNPSNGTTVLRMSLTQSEDLRIEVLDIAGRSIRSNVVQANVGTSEISLGEMRNAGVYQVRVLTSKGSFSMPLVVQSR